ncbi:MAG: cyclic nucleotide-binding domain-containing protein [Spirochaetia bacterium]|jgi:signal transduction histidine kinase|nr:cyclic nucleotide-binding domain-containing protein [Spirochaetia bacterium]
MTDNFFDFLRSIPFFEELSDDEIISISRYCTSTLIEPGQILFNEGDPADKFYIIMSGEVEVWKAFGTDDEDMLAIHGNGKLFGEMALIDNLPRSATVKTKTHTRLLQIGEHDFQNMIRENSSVAFSIVRSLSSMVRKSNETFLEDLKERNMELEKANSDLKTAHEDLIKQERLSNLGKFSSMILHDLRNPISTVKAYTELLLMDSAVPGKTRKYISNIKFETERINNLASELLDYSRGDIRLEMNIVDIDDFLSKLETSVQRRFSSSSIEIQFKNNFNDHAVFDFERMLRVMMNLAENARKALAGKGLFTITTEKINNSLQFRVNDTGEGMSPDIQKHIFEPFYSSSRGGGTGLGMVIVKNIVEAHEGALEISSSPGKGTEIRIDLPLR